MYRRPKFLEVLLEVRREMALEADYDVDLFAEIARSGIRSSKSKTNDIQTEVRLVHDEGSVAKLERTRKK